METIKWLTEFFFGNFWHFIELLLLLSVIFSKSLITIFTNHATQKSNNTTSNTGGKD